MRTTLSFLTAASLLSVTPLVAGAQQDESELRSRVSGMIRERNSANGRVGESARDRARGRARDQARDQAQDQARDQARYQARDKARDQARDHACAHARDQARDREREQARADANRSRGRDGKWEWDRARDNDRDRDRDRDEYRRARNDSRGYGWGRNNDLRDFERRQRDFEKRTRHWNSLQWRVYRNCEEDLLFQARWDRFDGRRDDRWERERIRDICERRAKGARW